MPISARALSSASLSSAIAREPLVVSPETTVTAAITQMSSTRTHCDATQTEDESRYDPHLKSRASCVIVVESEVVVGILTERDVVRLMAQQQPLDQMTIQQVMVHPVITLRESALTDLFSIVNHIQQHHIRHLPIVDDHNRLVGLVTHESLRQVSRPVDLLRLRQASEVMTQAVMSASPNCSMLDIAQQMARHHVSCIVLVESEGRGPEPLSIPVGILTERDLVQCQVLGFDLAHCPAKTVMSAPLFAISPEDTLWAVQQIMDQRFIRRLVVTGGQGQLLGLVTQTTVLQALNPLELYTLAEVLDRKVTALQAEKVAMLEQRATELEQEVVARTAVLAAKVVQEALLSELTRQIHSSLDLQTILETTVDGVRQVLGCDRVGIWRFDHDWQTPLVAESTVSGRSLIGEDITDPCIPDDVEAYRQGRICIVPDIDTADMADDHRSLLRQLQIRAKVSVPLRCGDQLWGLLSATESQQARHWTSAEVDLLKALSAQLQLALQQATTHAQLQAELQEKIRREAQSQAILTAIPDLMFRVGADGCHRGMVTEVRSFDLVPQSLDRTGQPLAAVLPQAVAERHEQYLHQALATGELQIYEQQVQVGNRLQDEEVRAIPCSADEVLFIIRDITEQKQAEAALRQSEKTYRTLVETLPDLLIQMDRQGNYKQMAGGSAVHVKYPAAPFSEVDIYDILPTEEANRRLDHAYQALETGELQVYEQLFEFEGNLLNEEVRIAPLNDQEVLILIRDVTERKWLEAEWEKVIIALRQSEQLHRTLVETQPDLIMHMDQEGNYKHRSGGDAFRVLNLAGGEVSTVYEVLPPELAKQQLDYAHRALETGHLQTYEHQFDLRGRHYYEEVRISPLNEQDVLIVARDIVEQKQLEAEQRQAEAALIESERRFRTLFEDTPKLAVRGYDGDRRVIYWNRASEQLYGYSAAEAIGQTIESLIVPPEARPQVIEMLGHWATGTTEIPAGEMELIAKDGTRLTVFSNHISFINRAGESEFYCVDIDLGPLKQAEHELQTLNQSLEATVIARTADLQEREQFLQTVLDTFPLSVFWKDLESRYLGCNRKFSQRAGLASAIDIIGKTDYELPWAATEADDYRADDHQVITSNTAKINIIETQLQADGNQLWIETHKLPLRNVAGEVIGVLGTYQDITERQQAETRLQASEARYRALIEVMPDLMIRLRGDGTYLDVVGGEGVQSLNPKPFQRGANIYDVTPPDHAQERMGYVQRALQTREIQTYEYKVLIGDEWHWEDARIMAINDEEVLVIVRDISDRKQAETALQASEQRFRAAIEHAPFPIMLHAEDGEILQINATWTELTGYTHADIPTTQAWAERAYGDLAAEILETVITPKYNLTSRQEEGGFVITTQDGDQRFWNFSSSPLGQLPDGRRLAISAAVDVTEQRQIETALRDSEAHYRSIFDQAAVGIARGNLKAELIDVNPHLCELLGYSRSELLTKTIADITHPEDVEANRQLAQRLIAGEIPHFLIEKRYRCKDGSHFWSSTVVSLVRDLEGNPQHTLGIIRDISKRKQAEVDRQQAEHALQMSEMRRRLALELSNTGSWEFDVETGVAHWSDGHFRLMGLAPGEVASNYLTWRDRVHPDDVIEAEQAFQTALDDHSLLQAEYRVVHPDGTIRWMLTRGQGVYDDTGTPLKMTGVMFDISERKQAEAQLRRYERIVSATTDGIALIDRNYTYQLANQTYLDLTDKTHDQVVGQSVEAVLGEVLGEPVFRLQIQPNLARCLAGESIQAEAWFDFAATGHRFMSVNYIPYRERDGTIAGVAANIRDITDLKQMQYTLGLATQQLQAFLVNAPVMISHFDHEGRYLQVNQAFATQLGMPIDEIVGHSFAELLPESAVSAFLERVQRVAKTQQPLEVEDEISINGETKTFQTTLFAIKDTHQGRPISFWAIAKDMTERLQAEAALKESEARWQFALEGSGDGVWDWNAQTGQVFFSHQWKAMLGFSDAEVEDTFQGWESRVHPDDLESCYDALQRHFRGETSIYQSEHRVRCRDGSYKCILARGKVIDWTDDGQPLRIIGTHTDISDRKQAEAHLHEITQRLTLATNAAQIGVWDFDMIQDQLIWDDQMYALHGITPEQFGGAYTAWQQSLHPDDASRAEAELQKAMAGEGEFHPEFRVVWPDGQVRFIQAHAIVVRDQSGTPQRMIGVNWDVSDRKQAEIILQQENAFRQQIVEQMAEGLCVCHGIEAFPFIQFTVWNQQMEAITGYTLGEINRLGWYQSLYVDETQREQAIARMQQMRQGDNLMAEEWEIHRKDGQQRTIAISTSIISNHESQGFVLALIQDITDRKQAEATLQNLMIGTAATTGQDFFAALVRHITTALAVPYAMVTEQTQGELQTLAFCAEGTLQPDFAYNPANTPCERTLQEGHFYCVDHLQQHFPRDLDLVKMAAQSYLGIALRDAEGNVIGELCILDKKPLQNPQQAEQILRIFAARAAAELQRQRATLELEQLNQTLEARVAERTDALLERELRYKSLMEGASDAIVIFDCQGNIIEANHQAEILLGYSKVELIASTFDQLRPPTEKAQASHFKKIDQQVHSRLSDVNFRRKDGVFTPVDMAAAVIEINGENIIQAILRDISDRKRLEAQRQQAEQDLKRLVQELSDFKFALDQAAIVATTDAKGVIIYANDRFCEVSGYDREELLGQTHRLVNSGHHPSSFIADLWRTIRRGEIWRGELCNRTKQGELYWVQSTLVPFLDGQGKPFQYLTIRFDITDRKQAENTIRQQASREKLLRETGELIRQSLDLPTIFATACQEIRAVLQSDRVGIFEFDPASGFNKGTFVAESAVAGVRSVLKTPVEDHCFGENYTTLYSRGRSFVSHDIYDQDLSPCHIDILAQFQVRSCIVMPLLCGETLWGLLCIHQCDAPRHWQTAEVSLTQRLSNQLALSIQQASLYEQLQQELAQRQQAQQQLTERNQELALSNQELARATRLKDEFLANMSHELRTPLNAILGMTEGLQEQIFGPVNPDQIKSLKTIERSGNHLLDLINDILDVAKIEAGQITLDCNATAVAPLCKSSLAFIKQQALKKHIQLDTKLPIDLPDLWIDERRIRQVLINLLSNAVKFTGEGGRITLAVSQQRRAIRPDPPAPLAGITRVRVYRTPLEQTLNLGAGEKDWLVQEYLCIAVIDTGIGIAPADMQMLFQPFVQIDSALNRQYNGTGLGLTLAKRLVELHGGQVQVTSKVGIGSCFTIELPCATSSLFPNDSNPPAIGHPTVTASSDLGNPTVTADIDNTTAPLLLLDDSIAATAPLILLAEDNQANVSTVSSYLKAKGYRIVLAANGKEAIAQAQSEQPDLILMDVQMPEMDGLEAMHQIRQDPALAAVPIIALTALAMAGDRERCLAAGATEYLGKPIKLKQLAATIRQLLTSL